jgi:hypothetical protein
LIGLVTCKHDFVDHMYSAISGLYLKSVGRVLDCVGSIRGRPKCKACERAGEMCSTSAQGRIETIHQWLPDIYRCAMLALYYPVRHDRATDGGRGNYCRAIVLPLMRRSTAQASLHLSLRQGCETASTTTLRSDASKRPCGGQ